ncbi:multidrug resistance efflux pump [Flavobacterium croceum DSM 17960]|uniref:Multidrug resistance efflux pump n=1 Tax=Flavobacterium croceum DSM 17960 TaxID=1121886 RepID=A0A2S4N707_9FLAO|nr:HlyD family efflux transporter periplasmic adaptor subunit [Flavobacterium croceum]POS01494.1 multidrug resistance efflux pump [Flavobacterium croceum DSM 17960]
MLNVSNDNKVSIPENNTFKSIAKINTEKHYKYFNRILGITLLLVVLFMFLPWTQNIKGAGNVTALKPNQRPQTIQTLISGRIQKWYVNEGDFVKQGDTILFISEIKEDYLDPNLVDNTKDQLDAKSLSVDSYSGKVGALDNQMKSINNERTLKIKQAENKLRQSLLKIKSDSMDLIAAKTQLKIATTQFNRSNQLHKEGLKPMTDVEEKRLKLQDIEAKIITQENKVLSSKNDYINAQVELNRINAEYSEKLAKAKSDQYTALSNQLDTKAQVSKLKNQYANYKIRNGMYYITAPQSGYVNRAIQSGIGENIKEGTPIVSIMPAQYELAVETYVSATDLPLIQKGQHVRIWFDGWPSIVFSGWPNASYGTFGGTVYAIENFMGDNGKYRILIAPDNNDKKWPKEIRLGSGAQTIALLKNVPIWYELWRNLNGFPPDYYKKNEQKIDKKDKK